jgi:hypothetical protein
VPGGSFVIIRYRETCENGIADEVLTWRVLDQGAALVGLNINSPLLLTD